MTVNIKNEMTQRIDVAMYQKQYTPVTGGAMYVVHASTIEED